MEDTEVKGFKITNRTFNSVQVHFKITGTIPLGKIYCEKICGLQCRNLTLCKVNRTSSSIYNIQNLREGNSYELKGILNNSVTLYIGKVTTLKKPSIKVTSIFTSKFCFQSEIECAKCIKILLKKARSNEWKRSFYNGRTFCINYLDSEEEYDIKIDIYFGEYGFLEAKKYKLKTKAEIPPSPKILDLELKKNVLTLWIEVDNSKKVEEFFIKFQNCPSAKEVNYTTNVSELKLNNTRYQFITKLPEIGCKVSVSAVRNFNGSSLYSHFKHIDDAMLKYKNIRPPKEKKSNQTVIIAGTLLSFSAIAAGAIFFFLYRRFFRHRQRYDYNGFFLQNGPSSIATVAINFKSELTKLPDSDTKPILLGDWENYVQKLRSDGDVGFSLQYAELEKATAPTHFQAHASNLSENRLKNRYVNIVAYDNTRVILGTSSNPKHNYINANYVDGYHAEKAYIAAQGPLPATFVDFWRMIWQERCTVIVVITNMTEKGRKKCDQYWPSEGEETYGNFTVKLLSTTERAFFTIRVFSIKQHKESKGDDSDPEEERMVAHYHFTDWKDHSRPAYALPVLNFVNKSAAANSENSGPIVVHCSAGVGRTGTYIMLDSMMREIRDKGTVSLLAFLYRIRQQRNVLVQTEEQFVFIHDAIVQFIKSGGDTEIKESELTRYCSELATIKLPSGSDEEDATTSLLSSSTSRSSTLKSRRGNCLTPLHLDAQFDLITSHQPKDYMFSVSLNKANIGKNFSPKFLPLINSRIKLPMKPGEENSDYINASYMPGFFKRHEFILTQVPLPHTTEHFWIMVIDHSVKVMVRLTGDEEEDGEAFENFKCEKFKVDIVEECHELNYAKRIFRIRLIDEDLEMKTTLITSSYWPESCTPITTTFEVIDLIKESYQDDSRELSIIIDKYGGRRAGLFCALSVLQDQLRQEAVVDVLSLMQLYQLIRPGILQSQMDLLFLYKAIESLSSGYNRDRDSGIGNCPDSSKAVDDHIGNDN
ncbi:DgyrCDS4270 [Dimorphilus gyrociliatus]|uniref:protein-tyrosine-phosphatase n=1 Tax=Dimorphilus gyrociliatus TaxID=2664684 RepID=A0A7I8VHW7_9ANNE|nr:DgyrCDS4270 [Dimorphilus gyrociliatus]